MWAPQAWFKLLCQHSSLANAVYAAIEISMCFGSLLMWLLTSIYFSILSHPCIPGMNTPAPIFSFCITMFCMFKAYWWYVFEAIYLGYLWNEESLVQQINVSFESRKPGYQLWLPDRSGPSDLRISTLCTCVSSAPASGPLWGGRLCQRRLPSALHILHRRDYQQGLSLPTQKARCISWPVKPQRRC